MDYFLGVAGRRTGPFPEAEVKERWQRGELPAEALCWTQGWPEWRPVRDVFPAAPAAPAAFGATGGSPPRIAPAAGWVAGGGAREPAPAPPGTTSGLAITSFVLGIAGLLVVLPALPAVICGHVARSRIRAAGGAIGGAGLALAGVILGYLVLGGSLLILPAIIIPTVGKIRETAQRSLDASQLREIGMGALIHASDHEDAFPQADSVPAYAAVLAKSGGVTDGTLWIATSEKTLASNRGVERVLDVAGTGIDPAFARAQLAYTAVVRGVRTDLPSTMPILWTRGLQPDGTWSPASPYGGQGGYVMFLGGNVQFYRSLAENPLLTFDGRGSTTDIRQTLPPDAVIAEPPLR